MTAEQFISWRLGRRLSRLQAAKLLGITLRTVESIEYRERLVSQQVARIMSLLDERDGLKAELDNVMSDLRRLRSEEIATA